MSKKIVELEEAKEVLKSDKVFYNGGDKFNYVDVGKYNSGITIEIPREWIIDKNRNPESPIKYIYEKRLTSGMNIDFDGGASFILGKYRLSKNGRPVFEITPPTQAKDVMILVDWGGAFNSTRGQYEEYAKEVGATFFRRKSSNGGGTGCDYWILPVGFVKDMKPRDVSVILKEIELKEQERIKEIDRYLEQEELEKKKSRENREEILERIIPIIDNIKTFKPDFEYEAKEENFIYKESEYSCTYEKRYTEDLIGQFNKILEREKEKKEAREKYKPMFQEMEKTIKTLGLSIMYHDYDVSVNMHSAYDRRYSYSHEGYVSFIDELTSYQEKIKREEEEARIKAEELKREVEWRIKTDDAKENGYPENFEFYNRLSGATGLSHAFVVERDGTIREPDYNNLRNNNHKYKCRDWSNFADGTQGYRQILPGELIFTYTKDYTAVPYIFDIKWVDGEITEAQIDALYENVEEMLHFARNTEFEEIKDFKIWIKNKVKSKIKECRKQLVMKNEEKAQGESLDEEIVELAQEKKKEEEKNRKAKELMKDYIRQQELKENN